MAVMRRPRPRLQRLEKLLWTTGLGLLSWVGFVQAQSWWFQRSAEDSLERSVSLVVGDDDGARPPSPELARHLPADPPVPSLAAVGHGEPVGRLRIPRLALSVMVAEGADPAVLRRGAGHLPSTALPGQGGNVGIAAHRDRHFRALKDVTSGDEIVLETVVGTFRYQVEWTRIVPPERVDVLHPTDAPALTLVTCYPFYYVGNAPDRFVVRARRLGWEPPRR